MLIKDTHWRHFPSNSDTLCVFYAPVESPAPALPYFKSTAELAAGRLLVNPGTDEFYQDCNNEILDIVTEIGSTYKRTIHYGYSQGATGALDIGLSDHKCAAIFAMSPHFVLNRRHSRSERLMSAEVMARSRADLIKRIRQSEKDIYLFLSCVDEWDGIQVRDARALKGASARVYHLMLNHSLPGVNDPLAILSEYLSSESYSLPLGIREATDDEQNDIVFAFDVMAARKDNTILAEDYLKRFAINDNPVVQHQLGHYWINRKDSRKASTCFARAATSTFSQFPIHDSMLCAGNCYAQLGMFDIALGYYRQARLIAPRNDTICICEARVLHALGRQSDILELLGSCILAECHPDTIRKISDMKI